MKKSHNKTPHSRKSESGNILFIILLAIALIGALTAAITSSSDTQNSSIDNETLAIKASEVQRFAAEVERAMLFIGQNSGLSETDIRFANPDNTDYGDLSADTDPIEQVFHVDGGGATYRDPPANIQTSSGGSWEFYGGTHLPGVGSSKADLVVVLPNVTQQFCEKINDLNDQTSDQPEDTSACLHAGSSARFGMGDTYDDSPNTTDESTFTKTPALEGCVQCASDSEYHFYHVINPR